MHLQVERVYATIITTLNDFSETGKLTNSIDPAPTFSYNFLQQTACEICQICYYY